MKRSSGKSFKGGQFNGKKIVFSDKKLPLAPKTVANTEESAVFHAKAIKTCMKWCLKQVGWHAHLRAFRACFSQRAVRTQRTLRESSREKKNTPLSITQQRGTGAASLRQTGRWHVVRRPVWNNSDSKVIRLHLFVNLRYFSTLTLQKTTPSRIPAAAQPQQVWWQMKIFK